MSDQRHTGQEPAAMTPEQRAIRLLEAWVALRPSLAPPSDRFNPQALRDAVDTVLADHARLFVELEAARLGNELVRQACFAVERDLQQIDKRREAAEARVRELEGALEDVGEIAEASHDSAAAQRIYARISAALPAPPPDGAA